MRWITRLYRLAIWHLDYKLTYELAIASLGPLLCYPVLISFDLTWKKKFLELGPDEFSKWAYLEVELAATRVSAVLGDTKAKRALSQGVSLRTIALKREARELEHVANAQYEKERDERHNKLRE